MTEEEIKQAVMNDYIKQAIMDAYNAGYRDAELDCTGCESSRDISEEPNADMYYNMSYLGHIIDK
jgi:hypothetical protein